jgi:hypothetical protein
VVARKPEACVTQTNNARLSPKGHALSQNVQTPVFGGTPNDGRAWPCPTTPCPVIPSDSMAGRNANTFFLLTLMLGGLGGCSSKPAAEGSKKAGTALDRIQGKAQVQVLLQPSAADAALNAGGPSVYLWEGLRRYRLFLKTPVEVAAGKEYIADGVYAQKVIDEIGDPDQGKNGYPLPGSCERVVSMAWPGLAFDVAGGHATLLRSTVKRYPARPVFLVVRLVPVVSKDTAKEAEDENIKEVSIPAEKQRAHMIEGPIVQPAPLWEPAGGTVRCKVIIGKDGKIASLETGAQLCESVPWSKFSYQPPVQGGHPVKVDTEVEVRFEARK